METGCLETSDDALTTGPVARLCRCPLSSWLAVPGVLG